MKVFLFLSTIALAALTYHQHLQIEELKTTTLSLASKNEEIIMFTKLLNAQGTNMENKYYTLRALIKGEK